MIADLKFNTNLQFSYQRSTELEPDLLETWEKLNGLTIQYGLILFDRAGPPVTKGFIDRLFLPGFAFQYRENSVWWDKLLKGKTAHIIITFDQPSWYYWFAFGRPSVNQLKKSTLEFCGVKPVKVTYISPIKNSELSLRKKWLEKIEKQGENLEQLIKNYSHWTVYLFRVD